MTTETKLTAQDANVVLLTLALRAIRRIDCASPEITRTEQDLLEAAREKLLVRLTEQLTYAKRTAKVASKC